MKKPLLLATAACAFASSGAYAQDQRWPKWYVGLSAGISFLDDSDLRNPAGSGNLEYDTGNSFTGAIGYSPSFGPGNFLNDLRVEAELGYRSADLDTARLAGVPVLTRDDLQMITYMGNLYYDFRNSTGFTPYVGAGAGWTNVHLSRSSGLGNTDTKDNAFAYQGMVGLAYAPSSIPLTEWSLGYRYFTADGADFGTPTGRLRFDDITSHNVEVGAKFRF